jgi:PAS domain S-box-containing protein
MGTVIASIRIDYFQKIFDALAIGTNGVVTVYRTDQFTSVLRWPQDNATPNQPLTADSQVRAALVQGAQSRTLEIKSTVDGVDRIYSLRRLDQYPFVAIAGMAKSDVLSRWVTNARITAIMLGLVLLAVGWLIVKIHAFHDVLESKEAFVRGLIDSIPSRVFALDLNQRFTLVNKEIARLFGTDQEHVLGKSPKEFFDHDVADGLIAANEQLLTTGTPVTHEELIHDRLLQEPRYFTITRFALRDAQGRVNGLAGVVTDVTEQRRAKEKILEANVRLSAIIDASMDAIISVGEDRRIVIFSAAAEKIFGLPATLAIGQSIDRFIPLRFRDKHAVQMERFARTEQSVRAMGQAARISALRADGTEFPIEAAISHISNNGRQLFTITIRDISERNRAELAKAGLESQLRESQKMEAVGTLAGGIAHDFNNIIAVILGNADLLHDLSASDKNAASSLLEIRKAGLRARDLVQQILSFSRRQHTELKPTALQAVIDDSSRMLHAVLPARVSLSVQCDAGVPPVMADASQIQQVIVNLVTNAMQAMNGRPGHILMRLDTGPEEPSVRLTVQDDGQGMDRMTLERIFEPFFTTKATGEGTGLGLSVVHGIVKSHKGSIEVNSTPGEGTTFTLRFPAAPLIQRKAVVPAEPRETPDSAAAPMHQSIMYIDDDESMVFLMERVLRRRGYRVAAFSDARDALKALAAAPESFDIVVTDYNMPSMSGVDVAQAVRELREDLPVVVISGFVDETLLALAAAAGVREVIFKVAAVEELGDSIERIVMPAAPAIG